MSEDRYPEISEQSEKPRLFSSRQQALFDVGRRPALTGGDQIAFSANGAGRLMAVSPAYYAYTGGKPIIPSRSSIFPAIHARDKSAVRTGWKAAVQDHDPFTADFRLLAADNSSRWFRLQSTRSAGGTGTPGGWSGVCVDIDDLKREQALLLDGEASSRRQLTAQQAIGSAWRKLQMELAGAAELHAVGRVAAALAHELNQPLTAASNYAKAAVRSLETAGEAALALAAEAARNAVEQVLRAGAIVRNLRDHSSAGEQHRSHEPLRLVMEEAAAFALIGVEGVSVSIRTTLAKDRYARINRIQIQQVLINLIRNATEAMHGTQRPALDLSFEEVDGIATISVADRGPGIAVELAGRLFSPCTSTKRQGMGIGLSICRTIVEAHGGDIWVEEPASGGAIFRFALPVIRHD